MILREIAYSEFETQPREWKTEGLRLGGINLLVGKNASGKTRTLNSIRGLAAMLAGPGKLPFVSGSYEARFESQQGPAEYDLKFENSQVMMEQFRLCGRTLLVRREGGGGRIRAEKEGKDLDFQSPPDQLAAVVRRDSLQHPFLALLHEWGASLRHYQFGTPLGQDVYGVFIKGAAEVDVRDPNQVVGLFKKALAEYGEAFEEAVRKNMAAIGYKIREVAIGKPHSILPLPPLPAEIFGLYVREDDLNDITDQADMSQGMFRALSLIIHLTYSELSKKPSCILIDDIGEGLDFDRAISLIDLVMTKARQSSAQLVMTTNDRFVMNRVPLDTWSVLQRQGGHCHVYNIHNSAAAFDKFKFTGMNNFDFFAFDFLHEKGEGHE